MLWKSVLFSVVIATAAVSLCGCKDEASSRFTKSGTNRELYQVKGVLKEVKDGGKTAVIAHEKIPDYMEAMTMDFDVRTPAEMKGLQAGDYLAFDMVVTTNDGWIERVRKLPPENKSSQPSTITISPTNMPGTNGTNVGPIKMRKSPIVEPLEVGQQVPDWKFTNQFGSPISLADFRGRGLAVTFIFTRCPFPTYCPRMNNNFAEAQSKLLKAGGPTNWTLLSISFDPEFDTPATLTRYSKTYSPDTNHWVFATGDFWNLDGLTEQLGLQFWKQEGSINHNLRTAVFDTQGRLHRTFIGNEWPVDELVAEVQKAARTK